MGYAEKIGNARPRPTVGDLEKARLSRQIEAEQWMRDHQPNLALSHMIAVWINKGGPAPWEKPAAAGSPHSYPQTRKDASAI